MNHATNHTVNIPFTKRQYHTLLLMAYLGDWMMNSFKTNNINKDFEHLEQYLFSFHKAFGEIEYVDVDHEPNQLVPSRKLEGKADEYIDDYDDYIFWEELSERLAGEEFFSTYSREEIQAMTFEQSFTLRSRLADKYGEEFTANGLENIILKSLHLKVE